MKQQNPFLWKASDYTVHVTEMDIEHQQLVAKMSQLFVLVQNESPREQIENELEGFLELVQVHFKDEEEFMKKSNFGGLETHKVIHQDLLKNLDRHVRDFEKSGSLSQGFFKFLESWLMSHFKKIDALYGQKK